MRAKLLFCFFLFFFSSLALADDYNNDVTFSIGDLRWCRLGGDCYFNSLNVTTINNKNVNGSLNVSGDVNAYGYNINGTNIDTKYVPYTGAISNVNLSDKNLTSKYVNNVDFTNITVQGTNVIWTIIIGG